MMCTIFRFTREQIQYIIYLWGEMYTNNIGWSNTNIIIYKKICELFNEKFDVVINYSKIEKKILYERSTYTAVRSMLMLLNIVITYILYTYLLL